MKPERLTITLANGQRRKIEAMARDARTSVATVIRQAVDKYVADYSVKTRKDGATAE